MALKLVTGPAVEPVTLSEAKLHCRVDISDDDALIGTLIAAARRYVEGVSRRALITQTWDLALDTWPDSPFKVPRPPLQSITSITYLDDTGAAGTVAASNYVVDTYSEPGRVALSSSGSWPGVTLYAVAGVRVRFVAGYGAAGSAVPQEFRQAILLLVEHWYEQREPVSLSGAMPKEVPFGVEALLWMDRDLRF